MWGCQNCVPVTRYTNAECRCGKWLTPTTPAERAVLDAAREWELRMREWDVLSERDTDETVRASAAAQDALRAAVAALLAEEERSDG